MTKNTRSTARFRRLHSAGLTLLLSAVGAVAGMPRPAAAATATCSFVRTVCLWSQAGYGGDRFTVQAADPATGICVNLTSHGWGDGRGKSARNTGNQIARLYRTPDCTSTPYQLMPGGSYSTIDFASNSIFVY
ncbi:peptidase inhibitor family I36 protein [Actinoplanes sp. NPDC051346]|uniref:peptidase inhibitor family I36 protein n=1 Tax=Actinoplanes sp. NPDC051346 TaxID=3155048 RepID=UPI00343F9311